MGGGHTGRSPFADRTETSITSELKKKNQVK